MKFLWTLAAKNLFRNRLRSIVSIIAIAISVMVVVFTRGLVTGFIDSTFSLYIKYDTGHIKMVNQEYRQKERLFSLNYPVDGFNGEGLTSMIKKLEGVEGIEMAVPRIKFGAMASTDDDLVTMLGWGVDPAKESKFTGIEKQLVEGRMIRPGEKEILLGKGLLKKLNRQVGDKVTILYNTSFNSFKGATLRIAGVIESGMPLLNDTIFYLPLDIAQELLIMPDQATEVLLVTPNAKEAAAFYPGVKELFAAEGAEERYSVEPWNKANSVLEYMQVAIRIYDVIYVFLVLLASIVVINTMVMIVKERTREIGMMTALGLQSRDILKLFIMEGTVMGTTGSLLGAVLGGIVTKVLSVNGFDYSAIVSGMGNEFLMNPVIYPTFSVTHMIYGFLLGVIVTAVTCIIPARRAARLEPSEALREF